MSKGILIHVPRDRWTASELLQSMEDPGRRAGKPVGSHIDDLTALNKAIILCRLHETQFASTAKKYGYFRSENDNLLVVRGNCDICRNFDVQSSLFLHESLLPSNRGERPMNGYTRNR